MAEMTLNARVARAKGWMHLGNQDVGVPVGMATPARDWQRNIADAWELVEEMQRDGWEWTAEYTSPDNVTRFSMWRRADNEAGVQVEDGEGSTAPEAICLAYLAIHE